MRAREGAEGASGILAALPPLVLSEKVVHFLSPAELAALSSSCTSLAGCVEEEGYWGQMGVGRLISEPPEGLSIPARELCRIACERPWEKIEMRASLLREALRASSQDNAGERLANTLEPSSCLEGLQILGLANRLAALSVTDLQALGTYWQQQCGCCLGAACYWSSAGSSSPNVEDELEYSVADASIIAALRIVPYRAWWQPQSPTYNPLFVQLELFHPDWNEGKCYFRSDKMRYKSVNGACTFVLPKPALCVGGVARVRVIGRASRQTFGPEFGEGANDYFTCLSQVELLGSTLPFTFFPPDLTEGETEQVGAYLRLSSVDCQPKT